MHCSLLEEIPHTREECNAVINKIHTAGFFTQLKFRCKFCLFFFDFSCQFGIYLSVCMCVSLWMCEWVHTCSFGVLQHKRLIVIKITHYVHSAALLMNIIMWHSALKLHVFGVCVCVCVCVCVNKTQNHVSDFHRDWYKETHRYILQWYFTNSL